MLRMTSGGDAAHEMAGSAAAHEMAGGYSAHEMAGGDSEHEMVGGDSAHDGGLHMRLRMVMLRLRRRAAAHEVAVCDPAHDDGQC